MVKLFSIIWSLTWLVIRKCHFWRHWWFPLSPTSRSNIYNDPLAKRFPSVLSKALATPFTVLICLSQTSPIWLVVGGLLMQLTQTIPYICKYSFAFLCFMSWKDFCNSLTTLRELLLMSYLISRMLPAHLINLHFVVEKNLYLNNEHSLYEFHSYKDM